MQLWMNKEHGTKFHNHSCKHTMVISPSRKNKKIKTTIVMFLSQMTDWIG